MSHEKILSGVARCILATIFLLSAANVAEADDELDAAEIRLACAICSMGAYSDDDSCLMRSMLTERDRTIEKIFCAH